MKTRPVFPVIAAFAVLIAAAGCSKTETSTEVEPMKPDATQPAAKEATAAAEAAKQAVTSVAEQASSKAQDLINQAKSLVDAQKYADASNILQQLTSLKLTPEQQKLVADMTEAIKKALAKQAATEGTKAVGDFLGGKK